MNKSRYYGFIFITFLTVVVLSLVWEFWLETHFMRRVHDAFEPEPLAERWEYVISIAIFVSMALLYPAIVGGRLIARQNEQYAEIKRMSEHDYLTGVYNRRTVNDVLSKEISRCKRHGHPLSVILLDIDYFKETNDQFGHSAGDKLLVAVANILRNSTRTSDVIGRWGGEEFIVVCPQTEEEGALLMAEKLRRIVQDHKFAGAGYKTVSMGVAEYQPEDDADSIVNRADKALYEAKHRGKNRIAAAA
jgi:diguanylate cyclase (GGDEF)-like protein